ncbi:hypothetical protein B0H67DRAFT_63408 [Lasiosphaeris hirsuta]|uniref:Uncharacterized protein n=1 Tax=Lasiosphaeris hirsuta TaxID=260670 RepID=A0AA40BBF7_9PEZI|nr:hypothetical protein B0H67DRAFT_63408 [Lasiosphaeris hirsuta]
MTTTESLMPDFVGLSLLVALAWIIGCCCKFPPVSGFHLPTVSYIDFQTPPPRVTIDSTPCPPWLASVRFREQGAETALVRVMQIMKHCLSRWR